MQRLVLILLSLKSTYATVCTETSNPADDGSSGPFYCINGGTAVGTAGGCTCTCAAGWEGTNCETDINECGGWSQLGNSIAGNTNQKHGSTVTLNSDGSIVAFGTPRAHSPSSPGGYGEGFVGVYQLVGDTWTQIADNIYGAEDSDWWSSPTANVGVAMSDDGLTLVMTAPKDGYDGYSGDTGCGYGCGSVRVFTYDGTSWVQKGQNLDGEPHDLSGWSVSLNSDGSRIAIGSPNNDQYSPHAPGKVQMFEFDGSQWVQMGLDIDGSAQRSETGAAVHMNAAGDRVVLSATFGTLPARYQTGVGHVKVLEWTGSAWVQMGLNFEGTSPHNLYGYDVGMSADGTIVAVGIVSRDTTVGHAVNGEGRVHVYAWDGSAWQMRGSELLGLSPSERDGNFGQSLSLSDDGNRLAVGAPFYTSTNDLPRTIGYVSLYEFDGDWNLLHQFNPDTLSSMSGYDVALSGDGQRLSIGTHSLNEVRVYADFSICQNGATCTETTDGLTAAPNAYHCACALGYEGTNCETETASPCTASAVSDDDGSTGVLFCTNGVVSGTTGACICTCNTGYGDIGCDTLVGNRIGLIEPWYNWTWTIYLFGALLVLCCGICGTKRFTVDEKISRFWVAERKKKKRQDDKKEGKLRYILTNP